MNNCSFDFDLSKVFGNQFFICEGKNDEAHQDKLRFPIENITSEVIQKKTIFCVENDYNLPRESYVGENSHSTLFAMLHNDGKNYILGCTTVVIQKDISQLNVTNMTLFYQGMLPERMVSGVLISLMNKIFEVAKRENILHVVLKHPSPSDFDPLFDQFNPIKKEVSGEVTVKALLRQEVFRTVTYKV